MLSHSYLLISNLKEFLSDKPFYDNRKISRIEELLMKYIKSDSAKDNKYILNEIEKIIFEDRNQYIGKLFKVKVKYAANSLATEIDLCNRHIWVMWSVISRLKIFQRQRLIKNNSSFINEINNNGFLLLPDFLDKTTCEKVYNDSLNYPIALNKSDTSTISRNLLRIKDFSISFYRNDHTSLLLKKIIVNINNLGFNKSLRQTSNLVKRTSFWQKLNITKSCDDIQKDCHMDTFFPSLKFWYFPLKVETNKSFKYAKKSNIMSFERLNVESNKFKQINNVNTKLLENRSTLKNNNSSSYESTLQGSLRFTSEEMKQMNLQLKPIEVPENTLLIADVSGMHSRGMGVDDISSSLRVAIHGNTRHVQVF